MRSFSASRVVALVTFIVLVFTVTLCQPAPGDPPKAHYDLNDVFIYKNKLIVEGKEFYMKGFNYSPQPRGMKGILANEGGGLCSRKKNSQGVMQSACFGEEYFDGMVHPDHPSHGPWFQQIWDRDFALMKSMGVNTIRVYHMNYITKSLLLKYPDLYKSHFLDYATDHRPFFDAAQQYGIKIICPVVDTETVLTTTTPEELKRYVEARVDEVGDHPALVMWAVGNELGLYAKPALRKVVNEMMDHLRQYTLEKWNRIIPVTTVEVDSPVTYVRLMNEMRVDVFTSNCGYRDVAINTIWQWDSNPNNNMPGFEMLSKYYEVPLLVGEYGMHDQDDVTDARPDWVNQQLKSMMENKEKGGIGFLYFEWNEEYLKPPNQVPMGVVRFERNTNAQGDSLTDGVLLADKAIQKPVVFEAAKNGLEDSGFKMWNYNADIYTLTGTKQVVVNVSEIPVRPFPTKRDTPPTIPGFEPRPDNEAAFYCYGIESTLANVCTGQQGYCIADNFCSCKDGFSGVQCEVVRSCYGIRFDAANVCNGAGTCTDQDSCHCKLGTVGAQCATETVCNGTASSDPTVCSGKGKCAETNTCICELGRGGTNCELIVQVPPPPSPAPQPQPSSSRAPETSTEQNVDPSLDRSDNPSPGASITWNALLLTIVIVIVVSYLRHL